MIPKCSFYKVPYNFDWCSTKEDIMTLKEAVREIEECINNEKFIDPIPCKILIDYIKRNALKADPLDFLNNNRKGVEL